MYQIGETNSGNILVEMTPREWEAVTMLFRAKQGFTTALGGQLARYRQEHGLSQREAAELLNISKSYISLIERGQAGNVSKEIYQRIIQLVNLS